MTESSMDPLQALAEVLAGSTSSDGTPLDDLLQACHGDFSLKPSAGLLLGQPELPFAVHAGGNRSCPAHFLVQQAQVVACRYCCRLHPILLSFCRSRGDSPAGTGSRPSTDILSAELRLDGGLASDRLGWRCCFSTSIAGRLLLSVQGAAAGQLVNQVAECLQHWNVHGPISGAKTETDWQQLIRSVLSQLSRCVKSKR